jgi:hypothetical protein
VVKLINYKLVGCWHFRQYPKNVLKKGKFAIHNVSFFMVCALHLCFEDEEALVSCNCFGLELRGIKFKEFCLYQCEEISVMVGHHKSNASRCTLKNLNNTDSNNHLAS